MGKPHKLTTRQYVRLVCDLNAKTAQMPPLFHENQQLDESELVDSLANKAQISHNNMLISQGLNPDTGYLETFVEHCKRSETTENIAGAKFAASDEDSDTKRKNKRAKFKEQNEHGKKLQKKHSKLYCSLHGENTSHTTRERKVLKEKSKNKPKYSTKDNKRKSREANILEKEASDQRAKYLKYKKLNKAFSKMKTRVILDDPSESNSSSSSEGDNSPD